MGRPVDLFLDCTCCHVTLAGSVKDSLRDMALHAHPACRGRNHSGDDSYDRVGFLPCRPEEASFVDRVVHLLDLPTALRAYRQAAVHIASAIRGYGGSQGAW